jgi:DNA-binding transcriptional MocR family regulator
VTFVPGSGFFADGGVDSGDSGARLSFSFPSIADIRIGADLLVAAARSHLVSHGAA